MGQSGVVLKGLDGAFLALPGLFLACERPACFSVFPGWQCSTLCLCHTCSVELEEVAAFSLLESFGKCSDLTFSERLKSRNQQEEIERLRAENHEMREALKQALEEQGQVKETLCLALARMEALEKQREPPAFVKENGKKRPAEEEKPRKKREAKHHRGRARGVPMQPASSAVRSAICGRKGSAWHR
jgi:TolA-binding protein